mgnify:CR=1 FL=1
MSMYKLNYLELLTQTLEDERKSSSETLKLLAASEEAKENIEIRANALEKETTFSKDF